MRFSFTCILSFFLLVTRLTTAVAIPTPREGHHPTSSLSCRDSYDHDDDHIVELYPRAKEAPPPHHPNAWGKTQDKKLPAKSKQERKADHEAQQADAKKKRQDNHLQRQKNLAKHGNAAPVKSGEGTSQAKDQALHAKEQKVQAKATATQLKAKDQLAQKKAAGRAKFDKTREKYHGTDNLPNRKTTFTTPGGQSTF